MPGISAEVGIVHVVRLLDAQDRACLEVHVPSDKLQASVEMFLRLYPGKRLWIDGTIVQLASAEAPGSAPASPSSMDIPGGAAVESLVKLRSMMFAEYLESQRLLTEEVRHQFARIRESLEEVDLMARGARVVEFQEYLRAITAMNASPRSGEAEEPRSWRNEQFERFVIGGLRATKLINDAWGEVQDGR
jgi:hypothetical protein